ncbi:hypothetical protein AUM59_15110 [Cronobacter sakazakii]|nr:hypothetical protein [Cronobacter sakazakii]KVJ40612.1 hypothetical protein AWS33_09910 [Enterobacter cloacae subsp. cloacae]RAY98472.1 hypothetical protein DP187_17205 [Enterobacter cloacae]EGT4392319.1 hypothetical protein [Cronobacter sakazakii]EGT4395633.1 hypothetical protein [Cronobacter sakazakii]
MKFNNQRFYLWCFTMLGKNTNATLVQWFEYEYLQSATYFNYLIIIDFIRITFFSDSSISQQLFEGQILL